jgi:hypothetical protein
MRLLKFGCDDFGPIVEKNKAHPQGGATLVVEMR